MIYCLFYTLNIYKSGTQLGTKRKTPFSFYKLSKGPLLTLFFFIFIFYLPSLHLALVHNRTRLKCLKGFTKLLLKWWSLFSQFRPKTKPNVIRIDLVNSEHS